ncbi:AAA family ATPase [Butyrivibrio sp. WCE2006]|uniref:AAA family ATPase n=1 Tax=Butyrivibrio sp. WCE2006 TaxID=1410611 RepID=UPI0005D1B6A9|nr:AAA family ATPase [Butyrivibrio sp. WCE2006]
MGIYINPGNAGFEAIINGEYIDKTGMIALINRNMGKAKNLICISRPRRFGKSYAAQMLSAYYDCSCDSSRLFDGFEIAGDSSYSTNLNKYTETTQPA